MQKSLRKQLGAYAESIFSKDAEDTEWTLRVTPSFILLFKKSWAALDTRKYSIPSLYINAGSTRKFLEDCKFNKMVSTTNWFVFFTWWKDKDDIRNEKMLIENDIFECETGGQLREYLDNLRNKSIEAAKKIDDEQIEIRRRDFMMQKNLSDV